MPIHKVIHNGKVGYQWGNHGKIYAQRSLAERQARAAYASGYKGKVVKIRRDGIRQRYKVNL